MNLSATYFSFFSLWVAVQRILIGKEKNNNVTTSTCLLIAQSSQNVISRVTVLLLARATCCQFSRFYFTFVFYWYVCLRCYHKLNTQGKYRFRRQHLSDNQSCIQQKLNSIFTNCLFWDIYISNEYRSETILFEKKNKLDYITRSCSRLW